MNMFYDHLEKTAANGYPTFERPKGSFTNTNTNEYHMAKIYDNVAPCQVTLPIVISRGEGAYLWDVTGKKYIDWLAGFGCAGQGHCHPKILQALINQAKKLPMNNIAIHHDMLGPAAEHLTKIFGYDKILFMNSGAEAVDSAVLTARLWGYKTKKIPYGKATILFPRNNYWGGISSARAGSDDPHRRQNVEPLGTEAVCFDFVEYDNVEALEAKFKENPNICAFIFEAVQGYAGAINPQVGYYTKIRELCTKYNVLMICDEVQAGLGRTGKMFTTDWEGVRPDVITIGKSLGGDFVPVSAMLANNDVMDLWPIMGHKSTYSANSIACAVAMAAVDVLIEDKLIENAEKLGKIIDEELKNYNYSFIKKTNSGRGLLCSLEFKDYLTGAMVNTYLFEHGVISLVGGGGYCLRIMPPLCIKEEDMRYGLKVLREALEQFDKKGKIDFAVDIATNRNGSVGV